MDILDLLTKFSHRRINSKKFDEVLQLDGIPIWYFLEPLIKSQAYLPKPLKNLREIRKNIEENIAPSSFDEFRTKILLFTLRKSLNVNEKIKFLISKLRRNKTPERFRDIDILFLGYTNQIFEKNNKLEFYGFGDVVRALKKEGVHPLVLVCDPLSQNSFFKLLKYDHLLYDYVDSGIVKESERLSRMLNKKWKELEKNKLFSAQGKSYWKFIKNEMNFLFSPEVLSTLIKYYLTLKKIIKNHDVKLIYLTGFIGIYESAVFGVAYKLNKKIVYSHHGYGGYAVPLYLSEKFYKNFIFAASNEEEKKKLLRLGIKGENIFITGSPFFDKIADYRVQKEKPRDKKTVTLLTKPLVECKFIGKNEYFNYIRKYLAQISKVGNVEKIVIKLHPGEKYKSEYESIAKSLKLTNVKVVQKFGKGSLYSLLRNSNLLISFGSTADIEGLMLDKDVIVIEGFFEGLHRKDPYKKAVVQVKKNEKLAKVVDKILNNRKVQRSLKLKREKYLKKAFYNIDGKAHERVADLITSLIKERK